MGRNASYWAKVCLDHSAVLWNSNLRKNGLSEKERRPTQACKWWGQLSRTCHKGRLVNLTSTSMMTFFSTAAQKEINITAETVSAMKAVTPPDIASLQFSERMKEVVETFPLFISEVVAAMVAALVEV